MDCMNKKNPPQVVGMTYVPWQHWGEVYEPCRALKYGTLFPILNKPFVGCRCRQKPLTGRKPVKMQSAGKQRHCGLCETVMPRIKRGAWQT